MQQTEILNKEQQEKLPEMFRGIFTAKKLVELLNKEFKLKKSGTPFNHSDIEQYCYVMNKIPDYIGGFRINNIQERVFIFEV